MGIVINFQRIKSNVEMESDEELARALAMSLADVVVPSVSTEQGSETLRSNATQVHLTFLIHAQVLF